MVFFVLLLLKIVQAHALEWNFSATAGLSQSVQEKNDFTSNSLLNAGGTLAVLDPLSDFFSIGVNSIYSSFGQQSGPALSKGGDRSGDRFMPIAPTADLRIGFIRFRINYQFLGDYQLRYPTVSNQQLSYTKPKGFRSEIHSCWLHRGVEEDYNTPKWCVGYVGFFYEQINFAQQVIGSTTSNLANKLILSSEGITIGIGFR